MAAKEETTLIYRHPLWLRITHWVNAICVIGLFMSGLQIFNAHPMLYFGNISTFDAPALSIETDDDGEAGQVKVAGKIFDTTGVLGLSNGPDGQETRAFPHWITLPGAQDLATGRRWHFLFAWTLVVNGLVYLIFGFATGHVQNELWPRLSDLAKLPRSILDHLLLRFEKGDEARHYNVLQKLAYVSVVLIVFPVIVLAGLAMSPGMDAVAPFVPQLFGGRQTARSVHFILAFSLLGFFFIHIAMVILAGPINEMRSIVTGWFVIKRETETKQ